MPRQTKIVATLGPSSDHLVESLIRAGVNVVRLNFSHGDHEEHAKRIRVVREAAKSTGQFVAILADLQGPKIRIHSFRDLESLQLNEGDRFVIDTGLTEDEGGEVVVGTTYETLAEEVVPNDVLVLGDGIVELLVTEVSDSRITTSVRVGGEVRARAGINKRGGGLSAPALTPKDCEDIRFACQQGVDYIAVSFPREAADMHEARHLIEAEGGTCGLVAKLERAESVSNVETLDDIILASDAVMVARGDLGIEIGDARLMGVQKHIIARARFLNRGVITATQMMESMIDQPRATRAEVMDVANAVLDGTDAVMLSAETAIGRYPVKTVDSMARIIEGAETTSYATVESQDGSHTLQTFCHDHRR